MSRYASQMSASDTFRKYTPYKQRDCIQYVMICLAYQEITPNNLKNHQSKLSLPTDLAFTFVRSPAAANLALIMRFVTIALYSLKANVLNMLVAGQRSTSLNLNYLHSSTFQEGSVATPCDNTDPDICFAASNITENPIIL